MAMTQRCQHGIPKKHYLIRDLYCLNKQQPINQPTKRITRKYLTTDHLRPNATKHNIHI
jgi:hypothetical protein